MSANPGLYTQVHARHTGCAPTYNVERIQANDADISKPYPCAADSVNVHTRHTLAGQAKPAPLCGKRAHNQDYVRWRTLYRAVSVAAAGRRPPHSAQIPQAAPIKRRTAYRKSELKQRSQREPKRHCHVAKSTRTKNDVSPQRPRQPARETLRHPVSAASERESSRLPARCTWPP